MSTEIDPNKTSETKTSEPLSLLDRALRLFTEVEPGEGITALLLTLDIFLLLTAYYLLKTVREPLILASGGAKLKSYASGGQAVLLIGVVQAFAWLGRRYRREQIITITSLFFASNLAIFFALGRAGVSLGVPFYLWVGCFNLSVIAQFWSFANDVYTPEQGKRLFAIVGLGSSAGAVFGSWIAKMLVVPLGPYWMMLAAGGVILLCLLILRIVNAREVARRSGSAKAAEAPPGGKGGFTLILEDRYLLLIACLALLLNWVNSTGEYILSETLVADAKRQIESGQANGMTEEQIIGVFSAGYFLWVNTIGALVQLFLVSRIFKYLGLRVALLVLPVVAFGSYSMMAFMPILALIRIGKIAENSMDYSVQNTARQTLFLPLSREAKYNAKAAIDTFLVRAGDVLSALCVYAGSLLGLGVKTFAQVNLALVVVWIALVWNIGARFQAKTKAAADAAAAAAAAGS